MVHHKIGLYIIAVIVVIALGSLSLYYESRIKVIDSTSLTLLHSDQNINHEIQVIELIDQMKESIYQQQHGSENMKNTILQLEKDVKTLKTNFKIINEKEKNDKIEVSLEENAYAKENNYATVTKLQNDIEEDIESLSLSPTVSPTQEEELYIATLGLGGKVRHFVGRKNPKLEFIHIPKTAGSSIEELGIRNDYLWARYHPIPNYKEQVCSRWHLPPFHPAVKEIYDKKDTFCVVRNPFHRLVSDYRYNKGYRNQFEGTSSDYCSPLELNNFVQHIFNNKNMPNVTHWENSTWYEKWRQSSDNCHYLSQWEYAKNCTHVLRFETVEKDFNDLMDLYNISITLDLHVNKAKDLQFIANQGDIAETPVKSTSGQCTMDGTHLNEASLKILAKVYYNDFKYLGYDPTNIRREENYR